MTTHSCFADAHFEGEGDHRTLVVSGGIGADLRMRGKIAGSPIETDKSGHFRVREALRVLARNKWVEVEHRSESFASGSVNGHGS